MLANDLTTYLRGLNLVNEETFPIRVGKIDSQTPRGIMFMLPLGGYPKALDSWRLYRGNQQIIVRSPDPVECDAVCWAVENALTIHGTPLTLIQYRVNMMNPLGMPIIFPLNDANLYEGSINFDVSVIRL